jgi:hypothetical protein
MLHWQHLSSREARAIDTVLESDGAPHEEEACDPCWKTIPRAANEVSSVFTSVSPTLDDQILHGPLSARANLRKFKAPIGSTDALGGEQSIDDNSAPPTLDQ